jgi:DNA-binding transcriptional MerR regulator
LLNGLNTKPVKPTMENPKKGADGKLYYTIGEVAEMMNVNASLVRYWETEFSSIRPKKNRRGNRLFTAKDIEILKFIHYLVKGQGHTLEGAKKIIKQKDSDEAGRYKTLNTLERIRTFLVELRNEVNESKPA